MGGNLKRNPLLGLLNYLKKTIQTELDSKRKDILKTLFINGCSFVLGLGKPIFREVIRI